MATRWAIATGNWSDPLIWDNSLGLPTIGDVVHANSFTVTIDQDITVESIRTTTRSGGLVGGTFICSTGGITITANVIGSNTNGLTVSNTSGLVTMVGYCQNSQTSSLVKANEGSFLLIGDCICAGGYGNFINTGTGDITIVGDQHGNTGGAGWGFYNQGNCIINIIGNQIGKGGTGFASIVNTVSITITGNQTSASSAVYGFHNTGVSVINITGNQTGGSNATAYGFYNTAGSFTIVGNQTANAASAVYNTSGGVTHNITGNAYASSTVPAIFNNSTSTIVFEGKCYNNLSVMAIYSPKLYYKINSNSQWQFNDLDGNTASIYGAGIAIGNPAITNVRKDIVYGPSSEFTGTLTMTTPNNVLQGVAIDNTVGTLIMTPQGFIDALKADDLGIRLMNVSTVDVTGEQIKALKV